MHCPSGDAEIKMLLGGGNERTAQLRLFPAAGITWQISCWGKNFSQHENQFSPAENFLYRWKSYPNL